MTHAFRGLRLRGLVLWPVAATILIAIIAFVPPRTPFGLAVSAAFLSVYVALFFAGVRACRAAGVSLDAVFGALPESGRPWLIAGILGPLVLAFSAASMWATVYVGSNISPDWAARQIAGDDDPMTFIERLTIGQRYLLAVLAVVIAPVVEEFAFRGLLLRRWIARRGFWPGLIGTAIVFALLHPPNWIGSFVFSIAAGLLYLWSGSLALPIVVHMINNAFVALALLAQQIAPAETQAPPNIADFQANWLGPLLMLGIVGACIVAVIRPLVSRARAATVPSAEATGT